MPRGGRQWLPATPRALLPSYHRSSDPTSPSGAPRAEVEAIIAAGTPEQIARVRASTTGRYLAPLLKETAAKAS